MGFGESVIVNPDEDGMRLLRLFERRYPSLPIGLVYKLCRTGQVRLDGKRTDPSVRVSSSQVIRIPPSVTMKSSSITCGEGAASGGDCSLHSRTDTRSDAEFLRSITLYEDDTVLVLNKPEGLAVQGGPGITKSIDSMLASLTCRRGHVPRLVHRLDRDTAGCLVVAKRRSIAAELTGLFRSRSVRKIYWALVMGVPSVEQGKISIFVSSRRVAELVRVVGHGDAGALHAVSYYSVLDKAGSKFSWLTLQPVTGRTHQLRVQCAHIGHSIVGDSKYTCDMHVDLPKRGSFSKLHLLARRVVLSIPSTGQRLDVSASLAPHMQSSWDLLGFDANRFSL